jgi:cell shape-determining protein MreC
MAKKTFIDEDKTFSMIIFVICSLFFTVIISFYFAEVKKTEYLDDLINKMNDENQMIINENQMLRNELHELKKKKSEI